jgi:hypothetical protein
MLIIQANQLRITQELCVYVIVANQFRHPNNGSHHTHPRLRYAVLWLTYTCFFIS